LRVGRRFGVTLSERLIGEAETPRDLVAAILAEGPSKPVSGRLRAAAPVALETVDEPVAARTLIDALAAHARRHAARDQALLWRADGPPESIAYGALYSEALTAAGGLIERGVAPGDRVAIMLPTSRDFFVGFFAIIFAGAIPVPIYPPFRLSQMEDHVRRQAGILRNAQTTALIASRDIRIIGELLLGLVPELQHVVTVSELSAARPLPAPLPATPETVALIQYTSGSTGDPKGVVLTHGNLLANIRAMGAALEASSADRVVSWLPLYHDMGLIGCWLGGLYYGAPVLILSPLAFLSDPARWLWAIHSHRATISAAPNFAFEFCVKSIDQSRLSGLDLSCLRAVMNGAEPVSPLTLSRFIEKFAKHGFRR
jgi:acyl-CoA synthetase (AMP-forming)/AMP-acid ligase II